MAAGDHPFSIGTGANIVYVVSANPVDQAVAGLRAGASNITLHRILAPTTVDRIGSSVPLQVIIIGALVDCIRSALTEGTIVSCTTVDLISATQALVGREVKLYSDNILLGSSTTITPTGGTVPIFIFDPGLLLNEQPLRLRYLATGLAGMTDPVVPRIAPLQNSDDYSEPAPFANSGWAFMPRVRVNADGRIVLVMPVGSWNPQTAEQSLVTSINLELTEPVDANAPPPQLPVEPVLCMLGPELNITIDDGIAIERVEAVSIDEQGLVVYPLRLTGNTWRGRVAIPAGVQLFLQALGTNGSTIFLSDGAQPYTAPGKLPPCRPT